MTSNRPIEDWGKLIGDIPSATAILDRFLKHADIVTNSGKSYRLRHKPQEKNDARTAPTSERGRAGGESENKTCTSQAK